MSPLSELRIKFDVPSLRTGIDTLLKDSLKDVKVEGVWEVVLPDWEVDKDFWEDVPGVVTTNGRPEKGRGNLYWDASRISLVGFDLNNGGNGLNTG